MLFFGKDCFYTKKQHQDLLCFQDLLTVPHLCKVLVEIIMLPLGWLPEMVTYTLIVLDLQGRCKCSKQWSITEARGMSIQLWTSGRWKLGATTSSQENLCLCSFPEETDRANCGSRTFQWSEQPTLCMQANQCATGLQFLKQPDDAGRLREAHSTGGFICVYKQICVPLSLARHLVAAKSEFWEWLQSGQFLRNSWICHRPSLHWKSNLSFSWDLYSSRGLDSEVAVRGELFIF